MFLNLAVVANCSRCTRPATTWYQPVHSITAAAPLNPGPYPYCAEHAADIFGYATKAELETARQRIAELETQVRALRALRASRE